MMLLLIIIIIIIIAEIGVSFLADFTSQSSGLVYNTPLNDLLSNGGCTDTGDSGGTVNEGYCFIKVRSEKQTFQTC